jgi:uncharacterized membrane protein
MPEMPNEALTAARRRALLVNVLAVVTYIPLGILLRTGLLNWIIGPLYYVLVVATVPNLLAGRRSRDDADPVA